MKQLTIEEIKKEEYDILVWFHNFCEKNNLKYSLAYGTLIGAVRHKDFIPWDDDIDVCMPREDYKKLLDLLETNINKDYTLLSFEKNKDYIYPFAKIYNNKTVIKEETCMNIPLGVYIDIFPLDKIPNEIKILSKYIFKMRILSKMLLFSTNKRKSKVFLKNIIKKFLFIIFNLYGFRRILKKIEKTRKIYDKFQSNYLSSITGNILKEKMSKEEFNNLIKIKFRNHEFYCYKNYDNILKNIYGNYMIVPPVEKRTSHNMKAFYK